MRLEHLVEVDEADADGIIITEYDANGVWLGETVGAAAAGFRSP